MDFNNNQKCLRIVYKLYSIKVYILTKKHGIYFFQINKKFLYMCVLYLQIEIS